VRSICPKCVEDYRPTEEEAMSLNAPFEKVQGHTFRRGRGCIHCRQTGFHGRTGIYEIMPVSRKIRKMIIGKTGAPEIVKTAREEGMHTLRESAILKLVAGLTTVQEVIRVTGRDH
jgi:type II secretory ATPase GspE/PulE/Tfp pilus assembly ATPase PilB-like protein